MTVDTDTKINTKIDLKKAHGSIDERKKFVSEQYERLWDGVYEKAKVLLESGEKDLSRLHLLMRRNFGSEFSDSALAKKYKDHELKKHRDGFIFDKQRIYINDSDPKVVTLMTDAVKMREIIDAFGPDVQRVIETGSGWGKALFNVWLYGGPGSAEYYALELTKTGRSITELIAAESNASLDIRTKYFDYYNPDFSYLSDSKKTCFFTHHSIEQIPEIGRAYIDNILSVPGFHRCVNLEPIGWQIPSKNWLVGEGSKREMMKIDMSNTKFSEKRNQNKNFYGLLREYEKKGKIRIYVCRKYLCSHLLANATSLLVWGKGSGVISDRELSNSRRDDLL